MEIWKSVINFEGFYEVSNFGNVRRVSEEKTKESKQLKKAFHSRKYLTVCLSKNGKSTTKYIHRLVAEAFIPNPENKLQVNHINHNKNDNNVKNLEWCTNLENQQHYAKTNKRKGEKNIKSKLTEKQVLEIRKLGKTMTEKEIAKIYKTHQTNVNYILNYKTWKHI